MVHQRGRRAIVFGSLAISYKPPIKYLLGFNEIVEKQQKSSWCRSLEDNYFALKLNSIIM